jgi:hypothetical protein
VKVGGVLFLLMLFGFAGQAYGQLKVTDLKTTARDATGKPELHLLFSNIKGPTKTLRVLTDTKFYEIPWSTKATKADIWLAVGQSSKLLLQVIYVDGSQEIVRMPLSTKTEVKP